MRFLLGLLVLTLAVPARSTVWFGLDFSAPEQVVGEVVKCGNGPTQPSYINFGTPRIVSQYGELSGKALQFDMADNNPNFYYDQIEFTLPFQTDPVYWVRFDLEAHGLIGSNGLFAVFFDTPTVRDLQFRASGAIRLVGRKNGVSYEQDIGTFVENRRLRVALGYDVVAGRMLVVVNGATLGTFDCESDSWYVRTVRFSYGTSEGNLFPDTSSVGVDNIVISTGSAATLKDTRLGNASIRTRVDGTQPLIMGSTVASGSRALLVRASGPALKAFGIMDGVPDPALAVYSGSTLTFSNDDWPATLASTFVSQNAFAFPDLSKDAALLRDFSGTSTIHAQSAQPGIVLMELYDTNSGDGRLINFSTRNFAGSGEDVLIAGVTVLGDGDIQLLVRAVGPALREYGVAAPLADPVLTVYSGANAIAANDTWEPTLAPIFDIVGAFPLGNDNTSAAMLVTLSGNHTYTFHVGSANGGGGEALIELYELK